MNSDLVTLIKQWKTENQKGIRIVAFGSSNTEMHWHSKGRFNWVAWLNAAIREHVGKHVVIINQGIGGDTVKGLLERFERDIVPLNPNAVIITIGGNDANRGVPITDYEADLNTLIKRIQKIDGIPILQTYYCPLYEKMGKDFQRFPEFVAINRKIATELCISLIDQYAYFEPFYKGKPKKYKKLMQDGLHVNPMGNLFMGRIACRHFGIPEPVGNEDVVKSQILWLQMKQFFPET